MDLLPGEYRKNGSSGAQFWSFGGRWVKNRAFHENTRFPVVLFMIFTEFSGEFSSANVILRM